MGGEPEGSARRSVIASAPSFVTLRPDGLRYAVAIEPRLPTGEGEPRSFVCKSEAWAEARSLWSDHRLGFRDFTDGCTGREWPGHAEK